MRKVVVKKLILESYDIWGRTGKTNSEIMLQIDHNFHGISMVTRGFDKPNTEAFINMLLCDKDVFAELQWAQTVCSKENILYTVTRYEDADCHEYYNLYVWGSFTPEWARTLDTAERRGSISLMSYGQTYGFEEINDSAFSGNVLLLLKAVLDARPEFGIRVQDLCEWLENGHNDKYRQYRRAVLGRSVRYVRYHYQKMSPLRPGEYFVNVFDPVELIEDTD